MNIEDYYSLVRERLLAWISFELEDIRVRRRDSDATLSLDGQSPGGWQDFALVDVVGTPGAGVFVFFRSRSTSRLYMYVAFIETEDDRARIEEYAEPEHAARDDAGWREFDVYHDDMVFRVGAFDFGCEERPMNERDLVRLLPLA
jgi:hypothetical protein